MNKDLTVGKPGAVLRDFCVPLLGSIIFQQLYNIADSLVAGKFIGENALAAVGNSYEITLIFIAFAFGCNMGCSVVVSQLYGAKDYKGVKTAVYTASIFSALICGGLMVLGVTSAGWLLGLIRTPQEVFGDSRLYLDIYVYGLPFVFFYNIATGIFSAMGDSKTPFYFLAVSSVSNIAVDILFVSAFQMGVAGVAWDSIIYFTAIMGINPDLYEAAALDGANRWNIVVHIILPALLVPMTTMFILNLGFFMSAGFDQVYNFSNSAVLSVIDILDTYINRVGIESAQYSVATAVSLVKGVVGCILVLITHVTSKKLTGEGVW